MTRRSDGCANEKSRFFEPRPISGTWNTHNNNTTAQQQQEEGFKIGLLPKSNREVDNKETSSIVESGLMIQPGQKCLPVRGSWKMCAMRSFHQRNFFGSCKRKGSKKVMMGHEVPKHYINCNVLIWRHSISEILFFVRQKDIAINRLSLYVTELYPNSSSKIGILAPPPIEKSFWPGKNTCKSKSFGLLTSL